MLRDTEQMEKFEKDLRARIGMEQKNWEMKAEQSHRQLAQELEDMWKKRAQELEADAQKKEEEHEKAFLEMKRGLLAEVEAKELELRDTYSKINLEKQEAFQKLTQERKAFEMSIDAEQKKLSLLSEEMKKKIEAEQRALYNQVEQTLKQRSAELESAFQEKNTRLQKKFEEDESQRQMFVAERQAALDLLEKKYRADMDRLEKGYAARVGQLEEQKNKWMKEHEMALAQLENARQKTQNEADQMREALRQKEEQVMALAQQKEREFENYKKTVETEWPARFENRVAEISDKARKQLAEKEAEFAEARKKWMEEATEAKMKLSNRMNELDALHAQREEEQQRKYLQKHHELTVQVEKTMSDLKAKQMALESQKADYERLSAEAALRRDELEEAKKDLNKRVELMSQEFLRQQSIMDEQMRRIQNEKHELKVELENMATKFRQKAA